MIFEFLHLIQGKGSLNAKFRAQGSGFHFPTFFVVFTVKTHQHFIITTYFKALFPNKGDDIRFFYGQQTGCFVGFN